MGAHACRGCPYPRRARTGSRASPPRPRPQAHGQHTHARAHGRTRTAHTQASAYCGPPTQAFTHVTAAPRRGLVVRGRQGCDCCAAWCWRAQARAPAGARAPDLAGAGGPQNSTLQVQRTRLCDGRSRAITTPLVTSSTHGDPVGGDSRHSLDMSAQSAGQRANWPALLDVRCKIRS